MADSPYDPSGKDTTEVTTVRAACDAELNRRSALANLTSQAATNVQQYAAAGGDPQDILTAVQAWITAQEATK